MMSFSDPPSPPPTIKILDYPIALVMIGIALLAAGLMFVAGRYDPTGGTLTISLIVVLAFVAVAGFSVFFTIPTDEITSATIGGLVASFGAVIAYWLGRKEGGPKP
jgi:hypothetical protein